MIGSSNLSWGTPTPSDRSQTVDPTSRADVVGTTLARAALPSKADALLVRHQICSRKNLHTAEALSRAPIENDHRDEHLGEEVETYVESVMYGLQYNVASTAMMTRIEEA